MCNLVKDILTWAEQFSVFLTARYIPWKEKILIDRLSCQDKVFTTKLLLLPRVLNIICSEFDDPHIDLFVIKVNTKLSLYTFPISDPMAWKEDDFQYSQDDLKVYAFLPFALHLKTVLVMSPDLLDPRHDLHGSSLAPERLVYQFLCFPMEVPLELPKP